MESEQVHSALFQALHLPCGVTLKTRLVKAAMSDALADGCGQPTDQQSELYARWARGCCRCYRRLSSGLARSRGETGNLLLKDCAGAVTA